MQSGTPRLPRLRPAPRQRRVRSNGLVRRRVGVAQRRRSGRRLWDRPDDRSRGIRSSRRGHCCNAGQTRQPGGRGETAAGSPEQRSCQRSGRVSPSAERGCRRGSGSGRARAPLGEPWDGSCRAPRGVSFRSRGACCRPMSWLAPDRVAESNIGSTGNELRLVPHLLFATRWCRAGADATLAFVVARVLENASSRDDERVRFALNRETRMRLVSATPESRLRVWLCGFGSVAAGST